MQKPLVLVVDDSDPTRYLHARILRSAGISVAEASTGEMALQEVERLKPDLVLLDIKLPDVNGLEVCRRIRADPANRRIAVLHISSTYVTPEIEADSQESGADIYLAEPVEARELISVVRSLLRLREVEIGLTKSEERLRLATEAAEIGAWDVDLHTGAAFWDGQTARLLALPPGSTAGRWEDWLKPVHPEDRPAVMAAFEAMKAGAEVLNTEYRVTAPTGEPRWVVLTGRARSGKDQPARMVGVVSDISRRKRVEAEREEVLKLGRAALSDAENLAKLKDEFLATLSHELRAPMSVVTNWLYIMRSGKLAREEQINALDVIERNARQMTRLINDLLDMSRIVSGKVVLQPLPARIESLLDSSIENIRPAAAAKGVAIESGIERLPGPVLIDSTRLQQVFANLLSNAIKFTPGGGRVKVVSRRAGSWIEIAFADTGEGIAPDMLGSIFDRFRQADGSVTRQHGGLGLGLAIVRHIVELHGGTVSVKSGGAGKGSTFTVLLPFVPAGVESAASGGSPVASEMQGGRLKGVRLLAVDDDPDGLEVLAHVLQSEGAAVRCASDARSAVSAVESWQPDLLLLDIGLPGESGYDLLRKLRAGTAGSPPAIALTGYARPEDASRASRAGFQAHLAKPFDPDELCSTIVSLLPSLTAAR